MEIQSYNRENFNDYKNGDYENYAEEGAYEEPYAPGDDYIEMDSTQGQGSPTSRERERDRDRRRRHRDRKDRRSGDKDRHERRRDSSSRDRSRDRRDRERRHRDRDRSSHREDRNEDETNSNDGDGFRDYRNGEDRGGEKWMTDTPTNTILLRGLPQTIEETDIRGELMMFGTPVKDVRLMRRSSGASRGFAFVEFQSIADSQHWMDQNQGRLRLQNQFNVIMHYSTPKTGPEKNIHKTDWTCGKCGVHNFKRRDQCFKCNLSREESDRKNEADGFDQVGTNPCNTLIFRGLDALTTEDNLIRALASVRISDIKKIQVMRDSATNISRGYGFLELGSVAEANQLLNCLSQISFEVDGKLILVNFAKNTFSTVMAQLAAHYSGEQQGLGSWDYTQQSGYYDNSYQQGSEYEQSQQYGQYYDGQNYEYSQYYESGYLSSSGSTQPTQTDSTNAAAAVAQAAIQQANAVKHLVNKQVKGQVPELPAPAQDQSQIQTQSGQEYPVYPPPDVSQYQYEETSGYYYDPSTGLYYDASTQYYYNATSGQFLYWDAEKFTYLPAPTGDENSTNPNGDQKKEPKDKKEKVKVAKKIAKDMEKWAKSLNAQKDTIKNFNKTFQTISGVRMDDKKESATADAGFAILEMSAKGVFSEDKKLMPPPPVLGGIASKSPASASQAASAACLVASYGGDSDSDGEDESQGGGVDETKLTDWTKLACLLCKRQFQTKEILVKHQQMSGLHKENLEKLYKSKGFSPSGSDAEKLQYRDRAKERREKYGIPPPPEPKNRRREEEPVVFEEPTRSGIGGENIGNKLLQKMGWSAGQGLGKNRQGIVDPITAQRRNATAGLGMRGSSNVAAGSDSYKEAAKKNIFARYQETD